MSMKNSSDTIGNRTCDLLAFSAVPQPTAPLLPTVTENMEIKTNAVVRLRNFQDPQHPVQ
jgi:hypothetical protein